MTVTKVSPSEFMEQHASDLDLNVPEEEIPEPRPSPTVRTMSSTTVVLPEEENNDYLQSQRVRRDLRSSIGNISISKATERITYCWDNINVWTGGLSPEVKDVSNEKLNKLKIWKNTRRSKHILKDVRGVARPGELMCIMGASGAGKTTLLNVLTFRVDKKQLKILSGERTVNGVPINPKALTSISSFVQQDDIFIGSLTVREHLTFQALLKMHAHIPYAERIQRVDEVMNELGLTKCAETQIGYPGRIKGISGGEMKRLSFASEILTDPPLMFCDEPTSGLDSFMAQNVVSVLKELVNTKKKTIICTIHQPSSQVYSLFDKILLMAEGRVAYIGDTKDLPNFMKENGFPIPWNFNPADFFIETLAIRPGFENESREIVTQICDAFVTSPQGEELIKILATSKDPDPDAANYLNTEADVIQRSPYKANWITQFRTVLWRSWISYIKDPFIINLQIFQTVAVGLVVGLIYYGQKHNQEGIMNISGALFLILTQVTIQNIFGVLDAFIIELPIFLREHFNGMYRTEIYFITKLLAELPFALTWPVIFTSICYFMIGLYPDREAFLHTILIITLIALVSNSFGYLISCFSKSIAMALAVAPPFMLPLMLFGGFFLHNDSIPYAMRWIKYFSWFYYGNEALAIIQWEKVDAIDCNIQPFTCPSNGKLILLVWGYKIENYQTDLICLVVLVVGYRILAFLALLSKTIRYT